MSQGSQFRTLLVCIKRSEVGLRRRLAEDRSIVVIAQSSSIDEVPLLSATCLPDIMIIDVDSAHPHAVFKILKRCPVPAPVLLSSTHKLASQAFDHGVVDYLIRPFTSLRLAQCIEKVKSAVEARRRQSKADAESSSPTSITPAVQLLGSEFLDRLALRSDGTTLMVLLREVDYFISDRNYLLIHSGKRIHRVRGAMGQVQAQLDPRIFCRIHRSTIINCERVSEIIVTRHHYKAKLHSGKELVIGRKYAKQVFKVLTNPESAYVIGKFDKSKTKPPE